MFRKEIDSISRNYPRKLRPLSEEAFYRSPDVNRTHIHSRLEKNLLDQGPQQPFLGMNGNNNVETYGLGIQVMKIEGGIGPRTRFQDLTPKEKPRPQFKSKREAMEEIMNQIGRRVNRKYIKLPAITKSSTGEEPIQKFKPNSIQPVLIKKENQIKKLETDKMKPTKKIQKAKREVASKAEKAEIQRNESSESLEVKINIKQTEIYDKLENENYMPWESNTDTPIIMKNPQQLQTTTLEKGVKKHYNNDSQFKTLAHSKLNVPKTSKNEHHISTNKRPTTFDSALMNQKNHFSQHEKSLEAHDTNQDESDVFSDSDLNHDKQQEYETPADFSIDEYVNEQVRKNRS